MEAIGKALGAAAYAALRMSLQGPEGDCVFYRFNAKVDLREYELRNPDSADLYFWTSYRAGKALEATA